MVWLYCFHCFIEYQYSVFDTIPNKGADIGSTCYKGFQGVWLSGWRSVLPTGKGGAEASPVWCGCKWAHFQKCYRWEGVRLSLGKYELPLGRYAPIDLSLNCSPIIFVVAKRGFLTLNEECFLLLPVMVLVKIVLDGLCLTISDIGDNANLWTIIATSLDKLGICTYTNTLTGHSNVLGL